MGVLVGALGFALLVAGYIWRAVDSIRLRIGMTIILALVVLAAIPDFGQRVIRASGPPVSGFEAPDGSSLALTITALLTISLGFLSYCRSSGAHGDWRATALLAVAAGALFLMLPWSAPVWKAIPALAPIQFPFRNGAALSVAVAGLVASALDDVLRNSDDVRRHPSRLVVAAAVMVTLCGGAEAWRIDLAFRHPRIVALNEKGYVDIDYRMYVPPSHIARFSDLLGTNPGSFDVAPTPVQDEIQARFVKGNGVVSVKRAGFRDVLVSTDSSEGGLLELSQLYFPLWQIEATPLNSTVSLERSPAGLIEIPITPGKHTVNLVLARQWPEQYGFILTGVCLLGAGALSWFLRGPRRAKGGPGSLRV